MKFTFSSAFRAARDRRGFSLVEVAMALGVVSFGLIALLGLMAAGLSVLMKSKDLAVESNIARTVVTEARETPFSYLPTFVASTSSGNPLYFDQQGNSGTDITVANYVFKASTTITYNSGVAVDAAPTGATAATAGNVSLTVTVTKISNPANPYVFTTFVANNGL